MGIIMFALLAALFAVFALSAQAVEDLPCPAFRKCAPKADRFGFRRATDKPDFCITTLNGSYSVVSEYGFGRFGVPKCKVECRYILEDGCVFPFRKFPFFQVDPPPALASRASKRSSALPAVTSTARSRGTKMRPSCTWRPAHSIPLQWNRHTSFLE